MFSHLGHDGYSKSAAYSSENLVDVLHHAGLKVEWWENNTGPKGIADRIPTDMIARNGPADLCEGGECLDEILARKLERVLPTVEDNTVLVLHTMGSHGPSYFKRYPEPYRKFRPDCRTPELTTCTQQELVNAYDNTVVYTDHMLARFIAILKSRPDASTALFYMSDHGESLGEDGLYLHGAPYALAPDYQKKIPAFAWFSGGYAQQFKLDRDCAMAKGKAPISHDNMFDTVLGMMDVRTSVYKPALDLFAACHGSGVASN
jgi:lipid A ethanolaminephosphotransferase